MARSVFDLPYVAMSVNYLIDGALTFVALAYGLASEGNRFFAATSPVGIVMTKLLGLVAVTLLAWTLVRLHPPSASNVRILWRVGATVFGVVSAWNLTVIFGAVAA